MTMQTTTDNAELAEPAESNVLSEFRGFRADRRFEISCLF
jgi:hypothetical protein